MSDKVLVKKQAITNAHRFDRVLDILENCKLDIVYVEKLTVLTPDELRYFQEQIDRINGAISFLEWFKENMIEKPRKKFLGIF